MRWLLLSLALVVEVAQSQQYGQDKKEPGQRVQTGTEKKPFVIKIAPTPKTETEAQQEREERDAKQRAEDRKQKNDDDLTAFTGQVADYTNRLFWVGAIQAAILLLTWYFILRQEGTAKRQLRAYVHCAEVPTHLDVRGEFRVQGNIYFPVSCRVTITWENSGLTPARDCIMWTSYKFLSVDQPIDLSFRKDERSEPVRMFLGPKGRIASIPITIGLDQLVNLFEKKARAFIWGLSEYRDIFSKESAPPKHTEICLEIVVDVDPRTAIDPGHPPVIVAFQGIATHNSAS